ncbi:MAG TPA: polysaccharide biosynthesis C-terminal domain-containing protein [Candidatus Pelethocola excrementipullorum]|nr:polysaccharide biosynthesis C-terminal domain-containing protein [Candidatus Pelethocola excrementipullorum]
MSRKKTLLLGTVILTATGFLTRIIGFFYRIFLSHTIGAKEIGIFQLLAPVSSLSAAICIGGISTVMSRTIAAKTAVGSRKSGFDVLFIGTGFCVLLSIVAAFGIHTFSDFIAIRLLGESSCGPMLDIMAYSIPLATVHTCVISYYYAQKKTGIPSLSQLLEQIVRVLTSYLIYLMLLNQGMKPDAKMTVIGLLAGEGAACLFTMIAITWECSKYNYHFRLNAVSASFTGELFQLSAPLTANRICITLLHSVEAVLIPSRLRLWGLTNNEALSTYGVITGMALPMILFPSAITNSVAVMLLPSVAEDQASGNLANVRRTIEATMKYCLILGIFASGLFCVYGKTIGTLLFSNEEAGTFLQILAFISPFLYLNSTLSSIMNGLGKTRFCFYQNIAGLTTRILFVVYAIPAFGVLGYLWGVLASELISTILNILFLRRTASFTFDAAECILKPVIALLIALGISFAVTEVLTRFFLFGNVLRLLLIITAMGVSYLFPFFPALLKRARR